MKSFDDCGARAVRRGIDDAEAAVGRETRQAGERRREAQLRVRDAERTADGEAVEHDAVQLAPEVVVLVGRAVEGRRERVARPADRARPAGSSASRSRVAAPAASARAARSSRRSRRVDRPMPSRSTRWRSALMRFARTRRRHAEAVERRVDAVADRLAAPHGVDRRGDAALRPPRRDGGEQLAVDVGGVVAASRRPSASCSSRPAGGRPPRRRARRPRARRARRARRAADARSNAPMMYGVKTSASSSVTSAWMAFMSLRSTLPLREALA